MSYVVKSKAVEKEGEKRHGGSRRDDRESGKRISDKERDVDYSTGIGSGTSGLRKGKGKSVLLFVDDFDGLTVYTMLLGIRLTVGRISALPHRELSDHDFVNSIKMKIPRAGSASTPAHKNYDFKFKDYSPMVFRHLRERFGIDAADYMVSLTSDYILSEFATEGKSGSMFYFSVDRRFIFKTMSATEARSLLAFLPHYYQHVMSNPHTLITKFFGLHRVKPYHPHRKIHFVVMGNLFILEKPCYVTYDLKGSTVGRYTPELDVEDSKPSGTLKDLDFLRREKELFFSPRRRALLVKQLHEDAVFLSSMKIMDYSLLLGIHKRENFQDAPEFRPLMRPEDEIEKEKQRFEEVAVKGIKVKEFDMTRRVKRAYEAPQEPDPSEAQQFLERLLRRKPRERGVSMFQADLGGFFATNEDGDPLGYIYFFGIIDILQPYNLKKQIEHSWKSLTHERYGISAIRPDQYAARFEEFMGRCLGGKTSSPAFVPENPERERPWDEDSGDDGSEEVEPTPKLRKTSLSKGKEKRARKSIDNSIRKRRDRKARESIEKELKARALTGKVNKTKESQDTERKGRERRRHGREDVSARSDAGKSGSAKSKSRGSDSSKKKHSSAHSHDVQDHRKRHDRHEDGEQVESQGRGDRGKENNGSSESRESTRVEGKRRNQESRKSAESASAEESDAQESDSNGERDSKEEAASKAEKAEKGLIEEESDEEKSDSDDELPKKEAAPSPRKVEFVSEEESSEEESDSSPKVQIAKDSAEETDGDDDEDSTKEVVTKAVQADDSVSEEESSQVSSG